MKKWMPLLAFVAALVVVASFTTCEEPGSSETFTITFDANDGAGGPDPLTVALDRPMPPITNFPTRTGFAFAGYWDAKTGGDKYYNADGSSAKNWDKSEDATLYARWSSFTTITFNANTGTGTMQNQQIPESDSANLRQNTFTRTGYTFTGWATTATATTAQYADGASYTAGAGQASVTLYAVWTQGPVTTITFNANSGTGTMQNQQIPANDSANLRTNAFTRTDYTFAGWATTASGTAAYADGASYTAGPAQASVTLYAVWTPSQSNTNTITFNANGGTGGPATVNATPGLPMPALTAQAPINENYAPEGFMAPRLASTSSVDRNTSNTCGGYEKMYFDGYWDAQTGGKKYYNADMTSASNWDKSANTVLYAQWLTVWQKYNITDYHNDDFVAYFAETPPVIDGNGSDPAWQKAKWMPINYMWMTFGHAIPTAADFSGRFKVVWTADRLYVLAEIVDDVIRRPNDGTANAERNDLFEVFIDEDASGGARSNNNNLFAYHLHFYNAPSLTVQTKNILDYVTGANPANQLRNHHINYVVGINQATNTYTWELEMKVFNSSYPVQETQYNASTHLPVTLTEGKKMGFAAAYCDNDDHTNGNTRDHFIGSMYVSGANDNARNVAYQNSTQYARLYLVK